MITQPANCVTIEPMPQSESRIPSLDGIRAVAIVLVISAHAAFRSPGLFPRGITYLALLAYTGVRMFFVLSGFLITGLLLNEFRKSGTLSLHRFYWRRTPRIFPAMYVFLAAVGLGYLAGFVRIGNENPLKFFAAAAYVSDYIPLLGWPFHHTWSLSVEEQFYVVWPAVLLLSGVRKAAFFPVLLVLSAPIARLFSFSEFRFDTVSDSLAVGCLIAIYQRPLKRLLLGWSRRFPLHALQALPVLVLPIADPYTRYHVIACLVGIPLLNVAIGVAMLGAIVHPPVWLNSIPVVWLGRISYSLYLWHLPWVTELRIGWIWLPAALTCAWLPYRFIERPILAWRDRDVQPALG